MLHCFLAIFHNDYYFLAQKGGKMDFYEIQVSQDLRTTKFPVVKIRPEFKYINTQDLICKGGEMYAFWHDNQWDKNLNNLARIIDQEVIDAKQKTMQRYDDPRVEYRCSMMTSHTSNVMKEFSQYTKLSQQRDVQFNTKIIFSNETPKREDYSTSQLSYTPSHGDTPAFDELFGKLYNEIELEKILWSIGALLTNSMSKIQKFIYLYGPKGSGKGTVISLFEKLFEGYYAHINLARLTSGSEFATSQIEELPLLIDSDSRINKIRDDTNLLKLTSHEPISVNKKHKQIYDVVFNGLLVTASNQRYQVENIDAGITRRAIVVHPSGETHDSETYFKLAKQLEFELPYIAQKAIDHFNLVGPHYYEDYIDLEMAEATDHIFAFVKENYKRLGDPCTLKKASELYRVYLEDLGWDTARYKSRIKEELKRYYDKFVDPVRVDGEVRRNVFMGFKYDAIFPKVRRGESIETEDNILMDLEVQLGLSIQPSIFDEVGKDYPAQLTNDRGNPMYKWDNVLSLIHI